MLGYLCDNIGVVLACLPSGTTCVTGSPSCYIMTQPSGSPILSPVLFIVDDPFLNSKNFFLLVSPPFLV